MYVLYEYSYMLVVTLAESRVLNDVDPPIRLRQLFFGQTNES